MAYLSLTDEAFLVVFDEQHTEEMSWRDVAGGLGSRPFPGSPLPAPRPRLA